MLEGELTLVLEGGEHVLGARRARARGPARPPPARERRQRAARAARARAAPASTPGATVAPGVHGRNAARGAPRRRCRCRPTCRAGAQTARAGAVARSPTPQRSAERLPGARRSSPSPLRNAFGGAGHRLDGERASPAPGRERVAAVELHEGVVLVDPQLDGGAVGAAQAGVRRGRRRRASRSVKASSICCSPIALAARKSKRVPATGSRPTGTWWRSSFSSRVAAASSSVHSSIGPSPVRGRGAGRRRRGRRRSPMLRALVVTVRPSSPSS